MGNATNHSTVQSFDDFYKMTPAALRSHSRAISNRLEGKAASLVACAMEALAVGDKVLAHDYIHKADRAWKESRETEQDQIKRAAEMMRKVEDKGVKSTCKVPATEFVGKAYHTSIREVMASTGRLRGGV